MPAALPGVRRPRQQPRRLHAQHDRVARDGAHVAAVGAEHHLRAPPVGAVSDAHLAAAVRRADRDARAVHRVARAEHDRHGDRARPRRGRQGRRDAHGTGYDAWYPGLHRLRAGRSRTSPRSGPRRRGAAPRRPRPVARRFPPTCSGRSRSIRAHGSAARWRLRDAVEYMKTASLATLEYAAKYKDSLLYGRYLAGRRSDRQGRDEAPYAYVVPQDAARSGGGGRDAAPPGVRRRPRVPADGATVTIEGERFPAGRGSFRPTRSSRRSRAKCSSAEVPGDPRVAGRSARPALRRRRLDAAIVDGRAHGRTSRRRCPKTCAGA